MIKVLIAEDMPALLKKYQRLLEKDGELEVVAAVQNGYEAVMKTVLCQPDVSDGIEMETRTAAWCGQPDPVPVSPGKNHHPHLL